MALAGSPQRTARLPNLVIVGVTKAGTTSLFHYLAQHPDICAADVKELRYFTPLQYGTPVASLDTYSRHFRHCGQQRYALEATPGYFYGGTVVAEALNATCPAVTTLLSLRSPVDRCWSFYRFVKSKVRIPKDMTFTEYLDRCDQLHAAGTDHAADNSGFWGLVRGCYSVWLPTWTAEFGQRLHILFFDDLADDPRRSISAVCDWLDIDNAVVNDFEFAVDNKTEQYQNSRLQSAAVALNRRGQRILERHPTTRGRLRRAYYAVNKAPAEASMSAEERERLTNFYRPHNERLADQLAAVGVSLPAGWA